MNEVKHSSSKIFISSSNTNNWAVATSNTTLNFEIRPYILDGFDKSHFILGLEQLSVPLSVYAVNSTNNILQINGFTYSIPTGNYSIANLIIQLNDVSAFGGLLTFSYNTSKNLIKVVSTDPSFPTTIAIGFATTSQKILGVVVGVKTGLTYEFENQVNLTFTSGILVQLNGVSTSNRDTQNKGSGSSLLARVPINCSPFRILNYFNPTPFYSVLTTRHISNISISLLNDDLTPLVLQGNPVWYAVLRVDYADKVDLKSEKTAYEIAREAEQLKLLNIKPQVIKPPLFGAGF
jgi:hypothetical protein